MSDPLLNSSSLDAWEKAAAKSAPEGNIAALNWVTPEGISRQAALYEKRHGWSALRRYPARL